MYMGCFWSLEHDVFPLLLSYEYFHINRGLGSLPAFIFIWILTLFIRPASNAACSVTFEEYVTKPFYSGCPVPDLLKKIMAIGILGVAIWVQNIFTVLKMRALSLIVIAGLVLVGTDKGYSESFKDAFNSQTVNSQS
ncbi:solute carrier family 7 member 13 [Pelobates cultripes]|uniref:Solute carrier family 7 member 13 n=1 Tax=Pelobates cultripes TaxID=61616 RepID=A0AAD1S5R6_PELCU|nr:solute carrier family 7 member 13 [Pelobates cultripes]